MCFVIQSAEISTKTKLITKSRKPAVQHTNDIIMT